MSIPCYEVVTYTAHSVQQADAARTHAKQLLAHFPGFVDWIALSGVHDGTQRADIVVWQSEQAASVAAQAVQTQEEFAGFRASVQCLHSMAHYRGERSMRMPAIMDAGVEIGRFRLAPGVEEGAMRAAYARMVATHLSQQTGWLDQRLVKLDDGDFVDLAFASSNDAAKALCASWQGQKDCEAFLAMIVPVSMTFGRVCNT